MSWYPFARNRSLAGLALLWLALATQAAVADVPPLVVSPDTGTLGTQLTITGEGFGDASGAVELTEPGSKKRTLLKVLSWSPESITAEVRRGRFGSYTVGVRPKGKTLSPQQAASGFTLSPFVLQSITPPAAAPGGEVVLRGPFVGSRRGKAKVGMQRAKVLGWEPVVDTEIPGPPVGEIRLRLPMKLSDNLFDIELRTPAGTSCLEQVLEIVDGIPHMKPVLWAEIDGKRFVARGWKATWRLFGPDDCGELGVDEACLFIVGFRSPKRFVALVATGDYWPPADGPREFTDEDCLIVLRSGSNIYGGLGGDSAITRAPPVGIMSGVFACDLELADGKGPPTGTIARGRFYDLQP